MIKNIISGLRARRVIYRAVLFFGDVVFLLLSFQAAFQARFFWPMVTDAFPATKGVPDFTLYWPLQWMALGIWMVVFTVSGFYDKINIRALDELIRVIKGIAGGWVLILASMFFYREAEFSRLVLALSALFSFISIYTFREIIKIFYVKVVARWWEPHTVLILGEGRMAQSIKRVLSQHPEIGLVEKCIRDPQELRDFISANHLREVFMGEPDLDHATLVTMSEVCDEFGVPFRIVPDVLELRMGEVIIDESLGLPTFQVKPIVLHGWTYFYKRLFDIVFSLTVLSLCVWPFMFMAFVIWIDSPGPILYRQLRMGFKRQPFPFFKFRTMVQNADDLLEDLKAKNERGGPVFKIRNDPRVTRVGRWLRKYSLDELPQVINVLRGEMSLIGPRPQVLWEAAAYDDWARKRLNVLPGITGLWQVSGRAHLSYQEMIDLDVYYIEHWTPGLDLKILLRTFPTILSGHGAY